MKHPKTFLAVFVIGLLASFSLLSHYISADGERDAKAFPVEAKRPGEQPNTMIVSHGWGWAAKPNKIVTCQHVVGDVSVVQVFINNKWHNGVVTYQSIKDDVAIIEVDVKLKPNPMLIINNVRMQNETHQMQELVISSAINGQSGSPVTYDGKVIGMVKERYKETGYGGLVSANVIQQHLERE